jgi:ABC-type lipoprotein export system ATPase subunit
VAEREHRPLVEAQGLVKVFNGAGPGVAVLKGVNFSAERGELVILTGISGSGKTTLLNLLGCLDRPSGGRVLIDGLDTGSLTSDQLATLRGERIGFVFQHSHLLKHLNALENTLLPFTLANCAPEQSRGMEMLEAVGLAHRAHHRPAELSGGERQRVAIARALVREPDLILADEPTGNLDRQTGTDIAELLAGLVGRDAGRSVVIVTHQPELLVGPARQVRLVDGWLD